MASAIASTVRGKRVPSCPTAAVNARLPDFVTLFSSTFRCHVPSPPTPYGGLHAHVNGQDRTELSAGRAALPHLDKDLFAINHLMTQAHRHGLNGRPAQECTCLSAEFARGDYNDPEGLCRVEFFNVLNLSGVLPHKVTLQAGCPISPWPVAIPRSLCLRHDCQ